MYMLQITTTEQMTDYLKQDTLETIQLPNNVNVFLDDGQLTGEQTDRLESVAGACGRSLHLR